MKDSSRYVLYWPEETSSVTNIKYFDTIAELENFVKDNHIWDDEVFSRNPDGSFPNTSMT